MTKFARSAMVASLMMGYAINAQAWVLFDNLGGSNGGDLSAAYFNGGDGVGLGVLAESFTASVDPFGILNVLLGASGPGDGGSIVITLQADASGMPGTTLATIGGISDADILAAIGTDPRGIFSFAGAAGFSLTAGATYWVEIADAAGPSATTNLTTATWAYTGDLAGIGVPGQSDYYGEAASLDVDSGVSFQMSITDAPEPLTVSVLGAGLIGLAYARRRKANAT